VFSLAVLNTVSAGGISNCKQCAKLASAASKYYNEEKIVDKMVEYFQNSTCPEIKEKKIDEDCEITIKYWWPELVKVIFNDVYGWFKIATWCPELSCSDEKADEDTKVNCWDCKDRMNAQATYFDDALALAGVINGLNYEGFCEAAAKEQPDDVDLDECRQGMIQYIPRLMRGLKDHPEGDQIHRTFCKESVQCTLD